MQSFVQFPNKSIGVYRLKTSNPLNAKATLTVRSFVNESVINPHLRDAILDIKTEKWELSVNPHNYGPLDVDDYEILQQFFHMMISMELQFKVYSVQLAGTHPIEHEWTITVKYLFLFVCLFVCLLFFFNCLFFLFFFFFFVF
jgi:hypothetical protein